MKKPNEFTMAQAVQDFKYGARMYLKSDRDSATILVRIRTERPLMWFVFGDAAGSVHPGYWETSSMSTLLRVCIQLLKSSLADEMTRVKLELLVAFCQAPREERPSIAIELQRTQREMDAATTEERAEYVRALSQPRR